jgi:DNA-directed RNA polymerase subunit E'/Rpb7
MFFIVTIREVVSLNVRDSNHVSAALKARLEDLHVGRVLRGAGLVIRVDSLKAMGDALVDQTCHVPVIADLIVFRPFLGQVLDGVIVSSDAQGIKGFISHFYFRPLGHLGRKSTLFFSLLQYFPFLLVTPCSLLA